MIASALGGAWILTGGMRAEIHLLAFAVVAAGVAQLGWQWWAARRCGLRLKPSLDLRDAELRRVAYIMIPMTAGLGAVQLNTLTDSLIAMWFVTETFGDQHERVGPAILYYAQRLYQFPLGVFAAALATAIFPTLSRHVAEGNLPALGKTVARGVRVATFEALPCLMGLILVREPLIHLLFGRGEFAEWPEAAGRVGNAVLMYALGIWAYAVNQLIVRAFYALQDAKTPLKISVMSVVLNLALNLILVQTPLREAGLALSSSICATLQVIVLLSLFGRRVTHVNWKEITGGIARTLLATAVMAAAVLILDRTWADTLGSATRLAVLVAAGMLSFIAAAWALRCQEIRELIRH
jgi:putative peptidoglycan lipid II flippase